MRLRSIVSWLAAVAVTAGGLAGTAPASAATDATAPPPAPANVVSVEENDARIIYTGTWKRITNPFASGNGSTLSSTPGSSASFSFVGTDVTWFGSTSLLGGRAEVFVDGVSKGVVDTWSLLIRFRRPLFTATGLTPGVHTLRIVVLPAKYKLTLGSWVNIDRLAFTPAPLPVIGFNFDAEQFPATSGLGGTVTCSRPLTAKVAYTLSQGAVVRSGQFDAPCAGISAVAGVPIDPAGLASGPASITYTVSWQELDQQVVLAPQTQPVNVRVALSIGIGLDATGFYGENLTVVGGTVTCSSPTQLNIAATIADGRTAATQVDCTSAALFRLDFPGPVVLGTISVTAQATTPDNLISAEVTRLVDIPA